MTQIQDAALAQALWARSSKFRDRGEYYDALLDIQASYRLFSLHKDVHAEEVHLAWTKLYQEYQDQNKSDTTTTRMVARLEGFLQQIQRKRISLHEQSQPE